MNFGRGTVNILQCVGSKGLPGEETFKKKFERSEDERHTKLRGKSLGGGGKKSTKTLRQLCILYA